MFITSDHNPEALKPDGRCMAWPGPRMLIIRPQSDFGQPRKMTAQQYYFVFDFNGDVSSRFEALRTVIVRGAQGKIKLRGPLLYSENMLADTEVDRLQNAVDENNWFIESATDPADGRLTLVVLGAGIVENPLFLTFLENLNPEITEECTGECLAAIDRHLTWHTEASTS